jgi:hypothetical protein
MVSAAMSTTATRVASISPFGDALGFKLSQMTNGGRQLTAAIVACCAEIRSGRECPPWDPS